MKHSAVLTVLALLGACTRNPVSGRPELTVMSAATERRIGAEQAAEVARTIGLVDDPKLGTYVQEVGQRLAARSPRRDVTYTFAVVDMAEPNAFALPGGEIFVSRGLLVLATSEDELTGVLGHEIGHVAARHAARRVTRAAPLALVTALGAGITGLVSPAVGGLLGGVGELANSALLAPYSRDQEREADRVGQEIVAGAGYDPAAFSTFLHTLEREEALHRDQARAWSFFATHPPTPERVATTAQEAAHLTRAVPAPIAASDADFLAHLYGLFVGPSAYAGHVDRVNGIAPGGRAEEFRAAWRETAASFRPLTTSERRAIRETRLRIARTRHGETIGDVVRRAGSAWSAEEAAVANEVAPGDVLAGGRPVKVGVTEPYVAGY